MVNVRARLSYVVFFCRDTLSITFAGMLVLAGCSKEAEVAQAPPPNDPSFARLIATDVSTVANPPFDPSAVVPMPDPNAPPETPPSDAIPATTPPPDTTATPPSEDPNATVLELANVKPQKVKRPGKKPAFIPIFAEIPAATSEYDAPQVELGLVAIANGAAPSLELMNGEMAYPGDGKFVLKGPGGDATNRIWHIGFAEKSAEPTAGKVAEVSIRDNKLWFRWATDALLRERANFARNCVLKVSSGTEKTYFALRKPLRQAPVIIKFEEAVKMEWAIPYPPDAKNFQIDFFLNDEAFAAQRMNPKKLITAKKDTTWIEMGEDQGFRLKLDSDLQESLHIHVTPFFKLNADSTPIRITSTSWSKAEAQAPTAVTNIEARLDPSKSQANLNTDPSKVNLLRSRNTNQPAPQLTEAAKARLEKELAEAKATVEQIGVLNALKQVFEERGQLEIHAFHEVDEVEFDLAFSNALEEEAKTP